MKVFVVHHAFIYVFNLYDTPLPLPLPLRTPSYIRIALRFPQFQENIVAGRKNEIYNRNKVQRENKIHDVEMKSTTVWIAEGARRKMSQDSHVAKLCHNQCSFASLRLRTYDIETSREPPLLNENLV